MTKQKLKIKSASEYSVLIISFFCLFLILYFSEKTKNAITQSLLFCLTTIIPSIFPILTASFFILSLPLPEKVKNMTERITHRLFGLSGNSVTTIITGLTGGYNVSCRNACKLIENKQITENEAKRLAVFFTSPGLSFCINITGIAVYNSTDVGLRLFFAGIIADFSVIIIYNIFFPNKEAFLHKALQSDISSSFVQAVSSSTATILSITSWIILFSVIRALLSNITVFPLFTAFCELFSEVSSGVFYASRNFSLSVSAFCLYFGGFCIFLQQLPDILTLKIKPLFFLFIKLVRATFGVLLLRISYLLFPSSVPAFNPAFSYRIYSTAPIGSVALLFLCCVFMASSKNSFTRTENSPQS